MSKRYQLRYAAGIYWLLDMEQPGVPYHKPVPMNETGAHIWKMHEKGMNLKEIADRVSREHGVSGDDVEKDIQLFVAQLEKDGIVW